MKMTIIEPDWDVDFYKKEISQIKKFLIYLSNIYELSVFGKIPELVIFGNQKKIDEINTFVYRYCGKVGKDYTLKDSFGTPEIDYIMTYLDGLSEKMKEQMSEVPCIDLICVKGEI